MKPETKQRNDNLANRELTVGGVTKTYKQWAFPLDISVSTLYNRIRQGMSPEEAVTRKRVSPQVAGRMGRKTAADKGFRFN